MRRIPDDNLAYPILVTIGTNTGSGFYINTGSKVFFASAKHVLFNPNNQQLHGDLLTLTSYSKNPAETEKNIISLTRDGIISNVKYDDLQDVVIIYLGENADNQTHLRDGISLKNHAPSGLLLVNIATIKKIDQVLWANEVYIMGYPTAIGLPQMPQIDFTRPLLRSGIVAGLNIPKKTIILDCPAYGGNSGGLVIELEQERLEMRYRVIGIVIQFVPHKDQNGSVTNSGYTVAASMDRIIELINEF